MTTIRTARLILRPVAMADGPALLPLLANWDVVKWLSRVPWPYTEADMTAHLTRVTAPPDGGRRPLSILLDGAPIGQIACAGETVIEPPEAGSDVGFWLGEPYWGRGYMSEALAALVDHVFAARPEVVALRSGWYEGNEGSARVHAKAGFVVTGRIMHLCVARGAELPLVRARLTRAGRRAVIG